MCSYTAASECKIDVPVLLAVADPANPLLEAFKSDQQVQQSLNVMHFISMCFEVAVCLAFGPARTLCRLGRDSSSDRRKTVSNGCENLACIRLTCTCKVLFLCVCIHG